MRRGGSGKRERKEEEGREKEKGRQGRKWGESEHAEGGGGDISREVVRTETDNILVGVESQLQHSAVYSPQRDTEGTKIWDSLWTGYFTTKQTRRQYSDGSVDTERFNKQRSLVFSCLWNRNTIVHLHSVYNETPVFVTVIVTLSQLCADIQFFVKRPRVSLSREFQIV